MKKKLILADLNVDSFITGISNKESKTIKGGTLASTLPCGTCIVVAGVTISVATIIYSVNDCKK
ncbi:MAG: hypothetical protein A3F91_10105 [Flavobacteria bacterium RIFCSPLOWO2_12_FULL_35_11]|nr:MAG: hypothetical protein A3F91_10105 [Flavobacteria bacterium RIFCSPLOWO2_12_FULL_35_11]